MLENVIKKLFPIRDENNQPCTFPTFGSQVFGEDGDNRALWQAGKGFYADRSADSEKLGGKAPEYYASAETVNQISASSFIHADSQYVETGLPTNPTSASYTTFTAPENGYFFIFADRGSTPGNTLIVALLKPNEEILRSVNIPAYDAYATCTTFIPIAKGMKIRIYTDCDTPTWNVREQLFWY